MIGFGQHYRRDVAGASAHEWDCSPDEALHVHEFETARRRLLARLGQVAAGTLDPLVRRQWHGLAVVKWQLPILGPQKGHVARRLDLPYGWDWERLPYRQAYLIAPWWLLIPWRHRWMLHELGLRWRLLECHDGALYRTARPRGWAVASRYLAGVRSSLSDALRPRPPRST